VKRLHLGASDDHSAHDDLREPGEVLAERTHQVTDWYAALGRVFTDPRLPLPPVDGLAGGPSFLDVVRPRLDGRCDPGTATHAEQLLWSGQYVGDVDQLRPNLVEPAGLVAAARTRPWWRP
jgi:hypothetical protein